jgi:hypothetical protein
MQSMQFPVDTYRNPECPCMQGVPKNFISPAIRAASFCRSGGLGGGMAGMFSMAQPK